MKERELIEFISGMVVNGAPGLLHGIGDDCAVIEKDGDTAWLLTMDTLIEGVHFKLDHHPPFELGRKCVSVNVSDIAAMGGESRFVLLSVGFPSSMDPNWTKDFFHGIVDACKSYGSLLIGGDTVRSQGGVSITLTVIGEMKTADVVYRRGASPGDHVWVSGSLGLAAAGLNLCLQGDASLRKEAGVSEALAAHLNPTARYVLGPALARGRMVSAMMDLSDGLATDLAHLCKRSGVGALVEEGLLHRHPSVLRVAERLGLDPLKMILSGGEDYELLFTASPEYKVSILSLAEQYSMFFQRVGIIEEGSGVRLLQEGGAGKVGGVLDISYQGFDHFADS